MRPDEPKKNKQWKTQQERDRATDRPHRPGIVSLIAAENQIFIYFYKKSEILCLFMHPPREPQLIFVS